MNENFLASDKEIHTKQRENKNLHENVEIKVVPEVGLEPTRYCYRQILSLMRLPFRHSCLLNFCFYKIKSFIILSLYISKIKKLNHLYVLLSILLYINIYLLDSFPLLPLSDNNMLSLKALSEDILNSLIYPYNHVHTYSLYDNLLLS